MESDSERQTDVLVERRVLCEKGKACLDALNLRIAHREQFTPHIPDLPILKEIRDKLVEAWSSNDWSRFGAIVGLLWYRFDKALDHLDAIKRGIERIGKS